jgi:HD-like signal output (HDOD) protein
VASIERAIAQVGTQGLRSLIAIALVQPVLGGGSGAFVRFPERIWEYTVYMATAAEAYAMRLEEADGFAAQLLGLLQGLGSIVVYRVLHEQYAAHPDLEPDPAVFAMLLEARTASTAIRIAEAWEIDGRLIATLAETVDTSAQETASPLARSLRFGMIAGALIHLCRLGRLEESAARATLLAAHSPDPRVEKTWERLVKAYIRP